MTAQHRMTKAYPLACNCKAGWVSTFFLPTRTHPLACNCETGWVFFLLFFSSQRTTTTMRSHVGSLSSSASICTHDNNDKPPPRLQLRDGVGFYHPFFRVNERQRRRRAMQARCRHLRPASVCTHGRRPFELHPLTCECEWEKDIGSDSSDFGDSYLE